MTSPKTKWKTWRTKDFVYQHIDEITFDKAVIAHTQMHTCCPLQVVSHGRVSLRPVNIFMHRYTVCAVCSHAGARVALLCTVRLDPHESKSDDREKD